MESKQVDTKHSGSVHSLENGSAEGPSRKRRKRRASGWDQTPPTAVPKVPALLAVPKQPGLLNMQHVQQQQQMQQQMQMQLFMMQQLQQQALLQQQRSRQSQLQSNLLSLPSVSSAASSQVQREERIARRVYVGSLSYDVTESHIQAAFSCVGNVIDVNFPREPSGKSKGYCFVEFDSMDAATNAISTMDGLEIAGRPMKVRRPSEATPEVLARAQRSSASSSLSSSSSLLASHSVIPDQNVAFQVKQVEEKVRQAAMQQQLHAQQPMLALQQNMVRIQKERAEAAAMVQAVQAAALARSSNASGINSIQSSQPSTSSASTKPNSRIYVGSIMFNVTAAQIRQIFEQFGPVVSCSLIPNHENGKHKGYGFVEYLDVNHAAAAIQSMNGVDLCGRPLKVNWSAAGAAGVPTPPVAFNPNAHNSLDATQSSISSASLSTLSSSLPSSSSATKTTDLSILPQTGETELLNGNQSNNDIDQETRKARFAARQALSDKLSRSSTESPVIALRNMISLEEAKDPSVADETQDECKLFGEVRQVYVHVVSPPVVFVEFKTVTSAAKAQKALDGRYFGGRTVQADFYPIVKFQARIFA